MHYKEAKALLSSKNGMNIYRGCQHGCIYCDSRSTCYQMDHPFEDIEVKENAPELLEAELKKRRNRCMIGMGSMCDPYMPLEKELGLTRKCLEIIDKYDFGVTLITKSDLVLRDLDLLVKINKKTKVVIQMTLTTYDEDLCSIIEPNVCTTKRRVEVLKKLNEAGIPTIVWMTPFLPYINDNLDNLKGLLNYVKDVNAKGIIFFGFGLTLRDGNREYFNMMLDKHFKGLKFKYFWEFEDRYEVYREDTKELYDYLKKFCKKNNIILDNDKLFEYLNEYEYQYKQLSLFD